MWNSVREEEVVLVCLFSSTQSKSTLRVDSRFAAHKLCYITALPPSFNDYLLNLLTLDVVAYHVFMARWAKVAWNVWNKLDLNNPGT